MKLPFKKEEFLGNIRSGKRRENNSPCNTSHFNVYHDSCTSEYAIELFESIYSDKPDTLAIIPVMNMVINYEIYSKDVKCRGEAGKSAMRITNKGQKIEGRCNPEECEHAIKEKCTRTGRLYFRLVGIEDKGVWCYATKSLSVDHIKKYLDYQIEKGIDITKNEFLLTLNEKQGALGKVYAPDIKIVNKGDKSKTNENQSANTTKQGEPIENKKEQGKNKQTKEQTTVESEQTKVKNLYKYIEGKMVEYKEQKLPRVVFTDKDGKENIFFMTKTSKSDILNLGVGSEIEILKVSANKANDRFLMDYNVITKIEKNKKAV